MLFKKVYSLRDSQESAFSPISDQLNFLSFFRITTALVALIEIGSLLPDLQLFFSTSGTLIPQDLMYLQTDNFKYLYPLHNYLRAHDLAANFYPYAIYAYFTSLFFLLSGLFTRPAALISLLLQLIIFRSFSVYNYGYDNFITMSLFYCLVFPVGKNHSVDFILFRRNKKLTFNYRLVLQLHLCIVYFFSGIAKSLDSGWWDGNSVWRALASLDNNYFTIATFIAITIGIGTVLLELFYPALVYFQSSRKYALYLIVLMHASIAVILDLYAFSAIMITWNIAAFAKLDTYGKTADSHSS